MGAVSLETYTYTANVPTSNSDQVYTYGTSILGDNTYTYATTVAGNVFPASVAPAQLPALLLYASSAAV